MKSITFDEIEIIINKYSEQFAKEKVVGIGVSQRDNELKFVIMTEDEETLDKFVKEYDGKCIEGFPVHVEIGIVESAILTIDRSIDKSMDMDPWPFWMRHKHDFLPVRILLSPLIVCSWLFWRKK